MSDEVKDPYKILGVPYWATSQEIQTAFQKKLKESSDQSEVISAYGAIRDTAGQNTFLWTNIFSCLALSQKEEDEAPLDLPALIRELAFLSSWELGGDSCVKK